MVKNMLVIGAGSDFAGSFINKFDKSEYRLFLLSREKLEHLVKDTFITNDYFSHLDQIKALVEKNSISEIIIFNGCIYEGIENRFISNNEIIDTFIVNFVLPACIINKVNTLEKTPRYTVISSIAAAKLRTKNYYYGLSKQALEEFILSQPQGNFFIFRSGFIHTKLTNLHTQPPLSTTKEKAATRLHKKFIKQQKRKVKFSYSSNSIYFLFVIFRVMPKKLLDFIENRLI